MQFLEQLFDLVTDKEENLVCCPFPHKNPDGTTYFETNPSASVNLKKRLFHCFGCKTSMSETLLFAKYQGIGYSEALQILNSQKHADQAYWETFQNNLRESHPTIELLRSLGIHTVADELKLGYKGDGICFPVFMYDELLDIRTYSPGSEVKIRSERNAKTLILPFDLWRNDERPTLLCAGEKDMAIARAYGFNAITFTGGEGSFPHLFKGSFQGKKIYIAYDNDTAGIEGAKQVATLLKEAGAIPHIVTGHHKVCTNPGGDIHDFFMVYEKTAEDLRNLLDEAPELPEEVFTETRDKTLFPLVTLHEATEGQYSNRMVSSRVAVIANFEEIFHVPEYVTFEKFADATKDCTMNKGDTKEWALTTENLKDVLLLLDSGLKEKDINNHLRDLVRIPRKETGIKMTIRARQNVFKSVITDDYETGTWDQENEVRMTELVVYVIGNRLNNGEKYRIFYKPIAHPLQAMKINGIVNRVEESDNSVNQFRVTPSVIETLKCFQGDPKEKMEEIYERAKDFCGVETQKSILWTTELFYHTPLQFYFGKRLERAYLEPMIVGESRTGKSQTAKRMMEKLDLGVFASLKTSTVAGLIGGSDKTQGGGYKTKLGLIPRNHKGAIILEEFTDQGKDFVKQMTDIRSSNMVRLERVNGSTTVPAMVRMLSISNQPKNAQGQSLPLRQYPHGIKVLMDLIGASEDIARYDFFVLVDEPDEYTYPDHEAELEAFPDEAYKLRARWAWSRKPEQVILDDEVRRYIIDVSKKLNQEYNSHMRFFGSEAWKKLSRVAIAVASCTFSTDETGENIIVKPEHVSWARDFLISCYDNPLFKLKEYVTLARQYSDCPSSAVDVLQGIYNKHATLLKQMESMTDISQNQLRNVSGLDGNQFADLINRLASCHFFTWSGDKIVPSERFRKAMSKIDRDVYMKKVGED